MEAVREVATFLNKALSDDVIRDIANKCSFKNLKHADKAFKQKWDLTARLPPEERKLVLKRKTKQTQVFRKGNTAFNSFSKNLHGKRKRAAFVYL